jgi:hypothetical protein
MKEYQASRLSEMKQQAETYKFQGGLLEINKQEYEWQTSNMPKDTLGVILMYQD